MFIDGEGFMKDLCSGYAQCAFSETAASMLAVTAVIFKITFQVPVHLNEFSFIYIAPDNITV